MAHKHISIDTYTCDICNREVKDYALHTLEVDKSERYDLRWILMHRIYGKTSYQRLEVCNQCYSKLRKYVRKLSCDICKG